jgi:hypothetical protein
MEKNHKENTTIKIKCDNQILTDIMWSYLEQYKVQFLPLINSAVQASGGGLSDAALQDVNKEKLTMVLTSKPTDKGVVIHLNKEGSLEFIDYKGIEDKAFYALLEGDRTTVYRRNKETIDRAMTVATTAKVLADILHDLPTREALADANRSAMSAIQDAEIVEEYESVETVEEVDNV